MTDLAYLLHLRPKGKPEALIWTFGGMAGYHGINSAGVGQFANDLGGGPAPRFGMPHYPVKRLRLECATLDEMVPLLRRVPLWISGNYVLCDGGRILDVEATPVDLQLVDDRSTCFIAHSNHFVCPQHATPDNHRRSAPDSFARLQRMEQLVRSRFGRLGVDDLKLFLRDREGDPAGICRRARTTDPTADWVAAGATVASIIAGPARRRMHVAVGHRAEAAFELYRMDE